MDPLRTQRLITYIKQRVEAVFKNHPIEVVITIDKENEKLSIDVQSRRLTLYSMGQDPEFKQTVSRLCDVCANYFNAPVSSVRVTNSLLTPRPIQYNHTSREFTSWQTKPL